MEKIYILDVSGFIFRAYFALPQMTNARGESTNGLFGFIRSVLRLLKDFHPTHIVAVFDGPESKKLRQKIYADYKIHRKPIPEDLPNQIERAADFCTLMGIPQLSIPGVEADDSMGTVAIWAAKRHAHAYLCTSDKDLCQLVNNQISIINTFKDNLLVDASKVEELYGVAPSQIIDLLAIMGDSSDNIPGLTGFGPKTAVALLKEFGSLENILKHPEKVPGQKKQETLQKEADIALLSQQLATINTEVDFPLKASLFQRQPVDEERLIDFYREMNFNSLLKELHAASTDTHKHVDKHAHTIPTAYHTVDTSEELEALVKKLSHAKEICFDTETTGLKPLEAELVGIGFCVEEGTAWYVPTNGQLGLKHVLETIKPLFTNPHLAFYGHNTKYDLHILANYDIHVATVCFDTIIASYLLNSHERKHSLDSLTLHYFNKTKIETKSLIGTGKKQISMRDVPIEKVSEYCCEDVDYTCRLKNVLEPQLKERKLRKLFDEVEMPLLSVLLRMERHGIYVDVDLLKHLSKHFAKEIHYLEDEIQHMAGRSFKVNSPKQLSDILFVKMGIHPPKKTATGHSTDAEVLEQLSEQYPIAAKVLQYRSLEKLRSTYIDTLPEEVNPQTHRIHCTFNQFTAATGRLACQDPNLQNIPVRSEEGRKIREAFRPEHTHWHLLSADYSQIELRLLAHLSGDPVLIKSFAHNEDVHAYTASLIFNIPLQEVTPEQRQHAKAVNFGVLYGQQSYGLSQELGISFKEASAFIEKYFDRYPKVFDYLEKSKDAARHSGKAVTLLNRERLIPDIKNRNATIRAAAERLAMNTPLQGTAADLIKLAMIQIDVALAKHHFKTKMLLQIHDELLFEVPDAELEKIEHLVRHTMENVLDLKVPLVVDINIGKNWKEC